MRSALGRVRGLGASGEGAHHWLVQRITAIANVALVVWLVVSLFRLDLSSWRDMQGWMANPMVALSLILLTVSIFWHLKIGLQTLLEDYITHPAWRIAAVVVVNFYAVAGGAFAIFAVVRIHISGMAG